MGVSLNTLFTQEKENLACINLVSISDYALEIEDYN